MEYIRLKDVLHILDVVITDDSIKHKGKAIRKRLKELPTEDVVKVKHGEWKEHFAYDCWHYDCPFCDFGFSTKIKQEETPNYCEDCGAKMDLKEGVSDA